MRLEPADGEAFERWLTPLVPAGPQRIEWAETEESAFRRGAVS